MGEALRALVAAAPRIDGLVVPVGAGVEGETPWVAMPHVALPTLDTRLRDEGAPDIDRALRILRALAEALDAAHAQELFHGSLHPRDVFVDADGGVQITGFGVARALLAVGVRPPLRRPYTAPELITESSPIELTAPADHYALGAMAFELLTGHRLLATGTDLAPRLYRADGTGLDVAASALSAMLAERPEHRPARAVAFAVAVSQALRPDGETGRRASTPASGPPALEPAVGSDEAASDEALQLFARQGTLWEPRVGQVREAWRAETAHVPAEEPTVVAHDAHPPVATHIDTVVETPDRVRPIARVPVVPERPARMLELEPTPAPGPREVDIDLPMALPHGITTGAAAGAADPDGATGSPPAVVLALVLALGLAIGGAGGYLLGQRSGMRAALRAQGGEVALTEQPAPLSEPAPEAAPVVPAEPQPVTPERSTAPLARERPAPIDGRIVVRSTPAKAGVLVNGVWRGRTPLTVQRLALGTHAVRVVEDGYVPETRRVSLDARVPSATVSVQLERLAPARPAVSSAPRSGATTGSLHLESRPTGARVFVDGQFVGTTPLVVSELKPGTHAVRIEYPGHKPWTTDVTIAAGQRPRVAASLEEGREEQQRP